jgi:hypothetical protein
VPTYGYLFGTAKLWHSKIIVFTFMYIILSKTCSQFAFLYSTWNFHAQIVICIVFDSFYFIIRFGLLSVYRYLRFYVGKFVILNLNSETLTFYTLAFYVNSFQHDLRFIPYTAMQTVFYMLARFLQSVCTVHTLLCLH